MAFHSQDVRVVRIFCVDFDATDSSSDEECRKKHSGEPKRVVHNIVFGPGQTKKVTTSLKRFTPSKSRNYREVDDDHESTGCPKEDENGEKVVAEVVEKLVIRLNDGSPGSVLETKNAGGGEIKFGLDYGQLMIDNHGNLLGEFSNLDDDLNIST